MSKVKWGVRVNREGEKVSVEIFGELHVLRGSGSDEYKKGLAADVDRRMKVVALKSPRLAAHQVATLVALHLADELAQLKQEQQTLLDMLGEKE